MSLFSRINANALRSYAVWFWSIGFFLTCTELYSLRLDTAQASIGYIAFALSALLGFWAEKKEFSTRIALYRLHDLAIYTPWRFLLLYFLWVSVLSPFLVVPSWKTNLLYSIGGWFSFLAVGLSSYFLFCERSIRGDTLILSRLSLLFRLFCFALCLQFLLQTLGLLGWLEFFQSDKDLISSYLYFAIGFPFLVWDFLHGRRHLTPRWLSGVTLLWGSILFLLLGRKFFLLSLLFHSVFLGSLFFYKRIRIPRFRLFLLLIAMGSATLLLAVIFRERLLPYFSLPRALVEAQFKNAVREAWDILWATNGLGIGVGITALRGIWNRVLAEGGIIGFLLYSCFFLDLAWRLYFVRSSPRVVVSNIAFGSLLFFLGLASHFVKNPYGAFIWVWYSLWILFALTDKKREKE